MSDDDDDLPSRSDPSSDPPAGDHASTTPMRRPYRRTDNAPANSVAGLCRVQHPGSLWFCTRPVDHDGDHLAGIGPYVEGEHILARWAR